MYCSVPPRKVSVPQQQLERRNSSNVLLSADQQNQQQQQQQQQQQTSTPPTTSSSNAATSNRGRSQQLRPLEPSSSINMANNSSTPFMMGMSQSAMFQSNNSNSNNINSSSPLPAGAASVLGGMMISGKTTGEEKLFSAIEIRESKGRKPGNPNDETEAQQRRLNRTSSVQMSDADRIRKLENELRRSQEQVRKKNAEIEAMKEKQKQQLADAAAAAQREKDDALEALSKQQDALEKSLQEKIESLNAQLGKLLAESRKREAEDNEAARKRDAEQSASATMWSTERQMMQKDAEKLRQQLEAEKTRAAGIVAELSKLRDEKEKARSSNSQTEQSLRNELAAALKEIRELKEHIESQRENVEKWENRVKNCNQFILQICQPKFSVVKDDQNLTPMTQAEAAAAAGTPNAKGFVLVPLMLMLDAYELLPTDDKKSIATKYETDKVKDKI